MERKDLLIGILRQGGYITTTSGKVRLTERRKGTRLLESDPALYTAGVGEMVLVAGNLSNRVLYDAKVIEVLSPVTGSLINSLADKGVVSLEEIRDQLEKLETEASEGLAMRKICALVIGHKKSSPGAVNLETGLTEFDFNEALALRIEGKPTLTEVRRIYRRTYKDLPGDINQLSPDFIVSLHCNAFNRKVSGTEVLYYHKSQKGKIIAEILLETLVGHLKLPDRGVKPKTSEDRGGYLLKYTNAPCVIAESFFIDNNDNLARAQEDFEGLADAYAKAIDKISSSKI
jgi:N-acetylmuramoyl-L-alanine amidase